MNSRQVIDQAREYVIENYMYMRKEQSLEDDESLLRTGIIDSLGIMELVGWIEETFGVTIDPEEITEQNFDTLTGIARFVASKTNVAAA